MPRPHKCRLIGVDPAATVFKPRGIPAGALTSVELRRDELEAIRLADLEGLYHDAAAERMGISRSTFGRLIGTGRAKLADALVNGRMIVMGEGVIAMIGKREFVCESCGERFEAPRGGGRPEACPACGSPRFHRAGGPAGPGRGPGAGGAGRGPGQRARVRRRRRDGLGSAGTAGEK